MNNTKVIDSKETSIIQGLINESVMADLLWKICNENTGKIKLIEAYECNNEHVGLIVEAKNKMTDEIERIIIDAVIGYPVTEQVYETVYKKGSSCDKRIIVYTEGFADLEAYGGMDDDAIKNLVANLNAYGTNIFLVNLVESKNRMSLDYLVIQEPFERPDYKITDLPTEEKLKEEEREKLKLRRRRENAERKRKQKFYEENIKPKHVQTQKSMKQQRPKEKNAVVEKKVLVHKNPIKRLWAWLNGEYDKY